MSTKYYLPTDAFLHMDGSICPEAEPAMITFWGGNARGIVVQEYQFLRNGDKVRDEYGADYYVLEVRNLRGRGHGKASNDS